MISSTPRTTQSRDWALSDSLHTLFEIHDSCLMKGFSLEEVILYPGDKCGIKFKPEPPWSYSFRELETIPDSKIRQDYQRNPAKVKQDLKMVEQHTLKEMRPFEKRPPIKLMLMKDEVIERDDEEYNYYYRAA
jgi:hypothetical protein